MTFPEAIRERLQKHLPPGTLRARFASGTIWVVTGIGVSQLVSALSSIVIARILGKDPFGEFGMVRNTIMMFGALAGLGLGLTTSKYVAELRDSNPTRAGRILGLTMTLGVLSGVAVSALVALAANFLADRSLNAPKLAVYIRLCAPLLAMAVINGVQVAAISGLEQFRILSWVNIITGFIAAASAATGAILGGFKGAIYGTLAGAFMNMLVLEAASVTMRRRSNLQIFFRGMWQENRVIFSFALPSMLSGLMVGPVTWAALRLLFIREDGPGQTAIFNAANQFRSLVLFIPGAIGNVVLPLFANLQAGVDPARYRRAVRLSAMACLAAGLVVAIPLMLLSPWVMALFGRSFSNGWLALCLLVFAAVLQATNTVIGQALAALGRMWWGLWLNCLWAIELLGATWFLVRYGAAGMGGAYVIAYALHTIQVWAFVILVIRRSQQWQTPPAPVATPPVTAVGGLE